MTQILKQSTAVDVLIGPFLDLTDGATAETGESPSVKLSKNGQTMAAKNDVTTPVHDADGYYNCELDATDTNTLGTMVLTVAKSANALPVRHEFQVVDGGVYDAMFGAGLAERPQGAPPATITMASAISYLYKAWRNKSDQSASTYRLYDDAGSTVDQKATISDSGTVATKGEVATGP